MNADAHAGECDFFPLHLSHNPAVFSSGCICFVLERRAREAYASGVRVRRTREGCARGVHDAHAMRVRSKYSRLKTRLTEVQGNHTLQQRERRAREACARGVRERRAREASAIGVRDAHAMRV